MKRKTVKFISIVLSLVMLLASISVMAFADDGKDVPVIFVDGINSSDTVNIDTGEVVFPPSANSIINGISGAVLPLVRSLATSDYSSLGKPVSNAVVKMFDGIACDENGKPVYNTGSSYERPAADDIYSHSYPGLETDDIIYYSYDWRLDMNTLASGLHDFIEYVLESTGAEKVKLIGFSMGTCVVMTYLNNYDYEYVDGVVLLAGGFNGVTTCGEPFSGKVGFDDSAMVRYINSMLGLDFGGYVVRALVDALYQSGVMGAVFDMAKEMSDAIMDDVYAEGLSETFAKMPGLWSLIPYDLYDDAKALLVHGNVSDEFVAVIDDYHYNVQGRNKEIIDGALERDINFGIVAKYGSTIPPVVESINNIGDGVIDTAKESFGATCATADTTLGEGYTQAVSDGHGHLSADGMIDASTCVYPEYTWFIKGIAHADHNYGEYELCKYILFAPSQVTVSDNSAFPQFLIENGDGLAPLTAENDRSKIDGVEKQEGLFAKIVHIIKLLIKALKSILAI